MVPGSARNWIVGEVKRDFARRCATGEMTTDGFLNG